MTLVFERESLHEILTALRRALGAQRELEFLVPNPDLGVGKYAGEPLADARVHRPWRLWMDVAERLDCHFLTLVPEGDRVRIRLVRRPPDERETYDQPSEKYGADSAFSRIQKLEEVCFLEDALSPSGRAVPKAAGLLGRRSAALVAMIWVPLAIAAASGGTGSLAPLAPS